MRCSLHLQISHVHDSKPRTNPPASFAPAEGGLTCSATRVVSWYRHVRRIYTRALSSRTPRVPSASVISYTDCASSNCKTHASGLAKGGAQRQSTWVVNSPPTEHAITIRYVVFKHAADTHISMEYLTCITMSSSILLASVVDILGGFVPLSAVFMLGIGLFETCGIKSGRRDADNTGWGNKSWV